MKKRTIIALIVAFALIIGGGMILVFGLSYAGGGEDPVTVLTESEHRIPEAFDSILIDTEDCHVSFVLFEGEADAHVVIRERERTHHSVLVEDGTLKIEMIDNRRWMDYVGICWKNMDMTVYLPQKQYESVQITTDTGDIQIPEAVSANEMVLRASTGQILCSGITADSLDCGTSTGGIRVLDSASAVMKLEASTGTVELENVTGTEIYLRTSTGKTEIEHLICKTLTCKSSTGDVDLEWVKAEEYLQVSTSTGNVEIENSETATVNIETSTGDVQVPAAWADSEMRIESDTGKIHFE